MFWDFRFTSLCCLNKRLICGPCLAVLFWGLNIIHGRISLKNNLWSFLGSSEELHNLGQSMCSHTKARGFKSRQRAIQFTHLAYFGLQFIPGFCCMNLFAQEGLHPVLCTTERTKPCLIYTVSSPSPVAYLLHLHKGGRPRKKSISRLLRCIYGLDSSIKIYKLIKRSLKFIKTYVNSLHHVT